jgi:hypothetical protein
VIQSEVEDALSEGMLSEKFSAGDTILIDAKDKELTFNRLETVSAQAEAQTEAENVQPLVDETPAISSFLS